MILFKISCGSNYFCTGKYYKKTTKGNDMALNSNYTVCTILKKKIIQVNAGSVNTTIAWPQ